MLGGFAIGIGAQVALLWQRNTNPSYKLASIPRYDDIVLVGDWQVLGAFSKLCAVYGKWMWLAGRRRGEFLTLLRRPGQYCGLPVVAFWQHNANAKC